MNPSREHQDLIKALKNHFIQRLGFTILSVDLPESLDKPFQIGRHSPDIIAKDQFGIIQIGEAKVGDNISSPESEEQFKDFSNQVMRGTNVPVPLHIIIFQKDYNTLLTKLTTVGLSQKIGTKIVIWTI
ncbi:MAG: hypothetical protein Q7R31_03035 [Candidatus Levybacteria bacterium]|nr:hypothetical protein [Candidatus Levybacteria bacterium]